MCGKVTCFSKTLRLNYIRRKKEIHLKYVTISTKINHSALRARHKKLKQNKLSLKGFFGSFLRKPTFEESQDLEQEIKNIDLTKTFHLSASRFVSRASLFAVSFLLIQSIIPSYASSDYFYEENFSIYGSNGIENTELLTAQDGFLLKPSLITQKSDRSQFKNTITYEVQNGDTISEIANHFGIKVQTILENNDIANPNRLKNGMSLTILPVDGILHTVKKGENISTIAKTYNVKKENILAQNKLGEETLNAEQKIIVPGGRKIIPRYIASRESSNTRYTSGTAGYGSINTTYQGSTSQSVIKPAAGQITQYYHRGHYAIDIGNRNKGPILAAANGVVIKAQGGYNGGYGNMIIIDHGNGRQTLYAHNSALYVKAGDNVTQGQTIAWMGNTGRVYGTTGIHLHFELRLNGSKVNPLLYIK